MSIYNITSYGAVGNGTTNDAAAINSATSAASSAGGGIVVVPEGTYLVESEVTLPANVTLTGEGPASVIIGKPGLSFYYMIRVTGDNAAIEYLTVDGGGNTDITLIALGTSGSGTGKHGFSLTGVKLTRATHNALRTFDHDYNNTSIRNCHIVNSVAGLSFQNLDGGDSTGLIITGNTFEGIGDENGGIALHLYATDTFPATNPTYKNVVIANNNFKDLHAKCAPIEPDNCTDIAITGNTISPVGRRGITTARCNRMSIIGNTIVGQELYAIEVNGGRMISIIGNLIENCDSFVQATNDSSNASEDVMIADNVIRNNGYGVAASNSIYCRNLAKRWTIQGNSWFDVKTAASGAVQNVIRIGVSDSTVDAVVRNNTYRGTASDTVVQFLEINSGTGHRIEGNNVVIGRAVNGTAGDGYAAILIGTAASDYVIRNNYVRCTGSVTATSYHGISNGGAGSYSAANVIVKGNIARGFNTGFQHQNTSGDYVNADNIT